jgi:quercetin dioxygenase-like cupin family protein
VAVSSTGKGIDVVDLLRAQGIGPVWGIASQDLNATLLVWPPGRGLPEHANTERDVLLIVFEGGGTVSIDREPYDLSPGFALLIPKGTNRVIRAGSEGIRYLSVHLRRQGVQIEPGPTAPGH